MPSEYDTRMTIRISSEMVRQLKKLCLSMSKQEGRLIEMSEVIRELIRPLVKMEKQGDLFKKKNHKFE